VEEQACQRVHRIGQQKTTYVKRFVVQGTVEERILQLQEKKKFLAQSVSMSAEEQSKVRMQDLVDLFRS
jgi:SNF2 family DNA or RNA helicase